MAKDPHKKSPASTRAERHPNLEEEIRRRAFEIYVERGREDGHDLDDWLNAEAELTRMGEKAA